MSTTSTPNCTSVYLPFPPTDYANNNIFTNKLTGRNIIGCLGEFDTIAAGGIKAVDIVADNIVANNIDAQNITINGVPIGQGGNFIDVDTHIVDVGTQTKRLDFNMGGGTSGTGTTIETIQTANRNFILPDVDGLAVVERTTPNDGRVIIGANNVNLFGTAKVQMTAFNDGGITPFNSVAQYRANQFGNSGAAPGINFFKSRGPITNVAANLVPVNAGDSLMDITVSGATSSSSFVNSTPLMGQIQILLSTVQPPFNSGYVATMFNLQLMSRTVPTNINSRRPVFQVSSEGVPRIREQASPQGNSTSEPVSGIVPLVAGNAVVLNSTLPADARILLTVQPGPAPLGQVYVSNITANTSFTITSTNILDTCNVYYQIWQPISATL
jgi:hypothetical protein